MRFCVAAILSVWASVEDWEAVDGSPNSIEKALQVVSSSLPNKAERTATGTMRWILLTALKVNVDCALCDAVLLCNVERHLEELDKCIGVRARTLWP